MHLLSLLLLVRGAAAQPAVPSDVGSPVAAVTKTFSITESELEAFIQKRPKLAREYYDLRRGALEEMLLDRLVDDAAKKIGVSGDTWLANEVEKRIQRPSENEIKTFFETRILPEAPGAELVNEAPHIKDYLVEQRRREAMHAVVNDLRKAADVRFKLPPARVAVSTAGPSRGPTAAPLTLVEFSDYQCPYCQKEEQALKELLKAYPTQVRLVVRDFPLDMHPYARQAARAAFCAGAQGRFWQMHDRMFDDPAGLDDDGLSRSAKEIGLDKGKFQACLKAPETDRKIADSQREGEEVGVDGTPALFLNGRPFAGAVSFADLRVVVEEELAAAGNH